MGGSEMTNVPARSIGDDGPKRWRALYEEAIADLPGVVRALGDRTFLCGMSACVDARIDMHDMAPLLREPPSNEAGKLALLLRDRVRRGVGGEIKVEWPGGPAWLRANLPIRYALGGTGPQAAWVLTTLGARAVMALEDRHAHMLEQIPNGVSLVSNGRVVSAAEVSPHGEHVPEVFIFEYTAGRPVGDVVGPRSSRIIARFDDRGIQDDIDFSATSSKLAPFAAAGLISGLNDEPPEDLEEAIEKVFGLARSWRDAGLKVLHLELAGYASNDLTMRVLEAAPGAVTSLGMSYSELLELYPGTADPGEVLAAMGERIGLERVCVHADTWAASVTLGDPELEERALVAGCAIAAARAATGTPASRVSVDRAAEFRPPPFPLRSTVGRWTFVACAAPYLEKPVTTLGLGDSFTAGCLLVLGQHALSLVAEAQHANRG